jgi:ribulose-5-phosphate 4-epimerase/fuculose-1-phosphate aldolase
MTRLERTLRDLVVANRILAREGVVDAYGHVSMRHPENREHYLLSRSRSPELVETGDIMEFDFEGRPIGGDKRPPYLERFIHGGIYANRPEVNAVVHSHADEVLPFSVSLTTRMRPVVHTAGCMGHEVPVWDIRDKFGDTNLLVVNAEQGRDLAGALAGNKVVLMSGHGFAAAGQSLLEAVWIAVYLPTNAKVYLDALRLGDVRFLSPGEIDHTILRNPEAPAVWRAWEYWARRAGCADMLETPLWAREKGRPG